MLLHAQAVLPTRAAAASRPRFAQLAPRTSTVKPKAASGVADPVTASAPILLHAGETTLSVPFSQEKAKQLQAAFHKLFETFAEKQKATRPKRWDMMEWMSTSDTASVEVFCNPNAHTTAFDAKLLITITGAGGLKVTTEARLSAIASDLDNFMQG